VPGTIKPSTPVREQRRKKKKRRRGRAVAFSSGVHEGKKGKRERIHDPSRRKKFAPGPSWTLFIRGKEKKKRFLKKGKWGGEGRAGCSPIASALPVRMKEKKKGKVDLSTWKKKKRKLAGFPGGRDVFFKVWLL